MAHPVRRGRDGPGKLGLFFRSVEVDLPDLDEGRYLLRLEPANFGLLNPLKANSRLSSRVDLFGGHL